MAQSTRGAPGWRENRAARIARQAKERTRRKQERQQPREPAPDRAKQEASPVRSTKPRIGFLRASTIERAFILLIYGGVLTLVALSIVGTFYGSHGVSAPITQPLLIWQTMRASGNALWVAIGLQVALSLTQYGARQLARHDWRWWLLYLAALGISVYFNVQAYYTPLLAYMLPGYAVLLIVAFDILPEFVSIRHD